jgi:uncharacterized protein involved in exopolysaccharide biosynthesis
VLDKGGDYSRRRAVTSLRINKLRLALPSTSPYAERTPPIPVEGPTRLTMTQTRWTPAPLAFLAIGLALLVSGIAACILSYSSPARYAAQTLLRARRVLPGDSDTNAPTYDAYFMRTEFQVLQSELVLDEVITNLNLQRLWPSQIALDHPLTMLDARERLRRELDLRIADKMDEINLRITDPDPTRAALIANGVAESYLAHHLRPWRARTIAITNALNAQLHEFDAKISAAQLKVDQLASNLPPGELDRPADDPRNTLQDVEYFRSLAIENQAALVRAEKTLATLKALDHQQLRGALPTAIPDATLTTLLGQLSHADSQLESLKSDTNTSPAELAGLKNTISDLNRKIDDRVNGIMTALQVRVDTLNIAVRDAEQRAGDAAGKDRLDTERRRPLLVARRGLRALEQSREALVAGTRELLSAPPPVRVEILRRATPPAEPAAPNLLWTLPFFAFGGVSAGWGLWLLIHPAHPRFPRKA